MDYMEFYNQVYDVLAEDGANVSDEAKEEIRVMIAKAYQKGARSITADIQEVTKQAYEEGRSVGHSLGYKEGFDAGRVNRKQRLLNSFGGR